ncbi:MAG: hypothetical protein ABIY47_06065 [Opitutaceae bacterium]
MKYIRKLAWAWWVVTLAMAGCAAAPEQRIDKRSDQEIVAEKSKQRWKALLAGDLKSAYELVSPAGRSVLTYEGYKNSLKPGFWKDARVNKVVCASPELCEVRLEIEYEYAGRRTKTPFAERWIKQDSNWWFLLER